MTATDRSTRRHILGVALAGVVLVGSIGVMAAATDMAGAIVVPGTLVVEGSVKKVQHPAGGVVKTLLVDDGARVAAGDLLAQMDETVAQANLSAVTKSLWELEARRARLQAERDGADDFAEPSELKEAASDPAVAAIVSGERRFFELRRGAREGQKKQLNEQIAQLRDEITGLTDQLTAKTQETGFLQQELKGVETLWQQRLVSLTRLTALQRDSARLLGERGRLTASIAQTRGKISETELKILQLDREFRSDVAKDLADVRAKYADTVEKRVAARDQTEKLELRAPVGGIVHDLSVHTRGGVIAAGETVMTIVPDADRLIVETRVTPQDIDQVKLGQSAMLRFTNFNQRTTPEIEGHVLRIGADLTRDDKTAPGYFVVRVEIPADALDKLGGSRHLLPGMPVEAFIMTGERTMLSYLMKPLEDQARRAFREK